MTQPKRARHYDICGATNRQGNPCARPAGWGTDHLGAGNCKLHGGSTRNGKQFAKADGAKKAVRRLGIPIKTTAQEALRDELARAAGNLHVLTELVGELDEKDLVFGTERRIIKPPTPGAPGAAAGGSWEVVQSAKINVLVKLWQEERDRVRTVAVEMERLGLEARQVRVNEAVGFRVLQTVRLILGDLALTEEQLELAKVAVPRRLRELVAA